MIDLDFYKEKLARFTENLGLFQHWINRNDKETIRVLSAHWRDDLRFLSDMRVSLEKAILHEHVDEQSEFEKEAQKVYRKSGEVIARAEGLLSEAMKEK